MIITFYILINKTENISYTFLIYCYFLSLAQDKVIRRKTEYLKSNHWMCKNVSNILFGPERSRDLRKRLISGSLLEKVAVVLLRVCVCVDGWDLVGTYIRKIDRLRFGIAGDRRGGCKLRYRSRGSEWRL